MAVLLAGCGEAPGSPPPAAKIVIPSVAYFPGKPGGTVGPLVVQVLGQPIRGVPGRSGSRDPISGVEVKFEVRKEDFSDPAKAPVILTGAETRTTGEESTEGTVTSDAQGYARVSVRLPAALGKWRVQAGVRGQFLDEKKVPFHVASGIEVRETGQENIVGRKVQVAVQVFQIAGETNEVVPAKDSFVQFRILEGPASDAHLGGDRLADRARANSESTGTARGSTSSAERSSSSSDCGSWGTDS